VGTRRRLPGVWIAGLLATMVTAPALAQERGDPLEALRRELTALQDRVGELEQRNAELESLLPPGIQLPRPFIPAPLPEPEAGPQATFYGYIKLDGSYDTSRTDVGNFARWVDSEAGQRNDDQFDTTANETRLGVRLRGPEEGRHQTSGLIEVDFYGDGPENRARLQMRHAYLQLHWPEDDLTLVAGQTWDLISPLNPVTLNYSVAWWAGNMGYRRPQLRLAKGIDLGDGRRLLLQGALARTIGDDSLIGNGDTGEDAGFPSIQGRMAYTFPGREARPTTLGVSGHWGEEECDADGFDHGQDIESWSLNLDADVPLCETVALKAEVHAGRNIDAYAGGIGQGMVVTTDQGGFINATGATGTVFDADAIDTRSGWAALAFGPYERWSFHLGGGVEEVDEDDVPAGARLRNRAAWTNAIYQIDAATWTGLELSSWRTSYLGAENGDSLRIQGSIVYRF
jgi:hypothetical protein